MSKHLQFYFGDETFLTRETIKKIIKSHSDHQIEYLEGQFDLNQLISLTQSTGLFAQKTLIILKNPFFLLKKCEPKDEKILEKTLLENHTDTTIIIYSTQSLDQRKKFVSLLKKHADTQQFNAFKDWEQNKILQWIQQKLKEENKHIEQDALFALEQLAGGSLEQCYSEIRTLLVFVADKETITLSDINALSGDSKATTYQLTESLKYRHYNDVLKITIRLLKNQEDPIKLMGLFTATFRLYYLITYLKKQGQHANNIATALKKNAYFIKLIAEKLTYSLDELKHNLNILADKDLEIKKGIIKADLALECAINSMMTSTLQSHQ